VDIAARGTREGIGPETDVPARNTTCEMSLQVHRAMPSEAFWLQQQLPSQSLDSGQQLLPSGGEEWLPAIKHEEIPWAAANGRPIINRESVMTMARLNMPDSKLKRTASIYL